MSDDQEPESPTLRQQAEERLKTRKSEVGGQKSEADAQRMLHELQVHQIELEMQNEELRAARAETEAAAARYTDLYDFAPAGYFTLSRHGDILQTNLAGARLLDKERALLVGKRFAAFVSEADRPTFRGFLQLVVSADSDQTCTVSVDRKDQPPIMLQVSATRLVDGEGCRLAVADTTDRNIYEERLRESEARLSVATKASGIGVWDHDIVNDALVWDERMFEIYGVKREEFGGAYDAWKNGLHPDDLERATAEVVAAESGTTPFDTEFRIVRPDGNIRYIKASAQVIRADDGTPLRLIGTNIDITDRKQAEDALRRSEIRQNKLVASIGDVIVIMDPNGITRYKSPNVEKLFGWLPEDLVGTETFEKLHPDDLVSMQKIVSELMEAPNASRTFECRYRCKDGRYKWIEMTETNLLHDPDIGGLLGNYSDITDRKQAEEALKESAEKFRAMIESLPLALYLTSRTENISEYMNPFFINQFGYTLEEVPRVADWFHLAYPDPVYREQILPEWNERVQRAIETQTRSEPMETVVTCKNGSQKNVLWGYVCTGEKNYVYGLDITKELELESQLRQAQKMESIGRLAGGVAHDFNNLLMGIMNYVELCRDEVGSDPAVREYLDAITEGAERSAAITRQLLAFARKQIVQPKELDLNEAIDGMLKLLRRLIGEDIEMNWSPGSGAITVKMDPSQIDQILANLTVNARDAIGGVGTLTIETRAVVIDETYCATHEGAVPGDYVCLTVSDSGCGMDEATMADVFEPFFTTKGVGEGTGLGLATVYGIVKQNNGLVDVYSELGKGTTFKIYIPRHGVTAAALAPAIAQGPPPRGTETVLITEDEKSIRITSAAFLKTLGYSVLTAEDAAEALRLAAEHAGTIHLLLTDVIMPGMSGPDLAKQLVETYPEMKCIFISGFTADVIAQRGVLEKDMNFLSKPFGRDPLARNVREVLDA